jgi:hypothetical protein
MMLASTMMTFITMMAAAPKCIKYKDAATNTTAGKYE